MSDKNSPLPSGWDAKNDEIVNTPSQIADHLQHVFQIGRLRRLHRRADLFSRMIEQFCRTVVPELQRRRLFRQGIRTDAEGRSLGEGGI